MSFSKSVNYHEDRADGGFEWDVRYDLGFDDREYEIDLRIDLVGADPGGWAGVWELGAEAIWNDKVAFSDGTSLFPVQFDVAFVNSGAHHTVTVYSGTGNTDMTNWYLTNPSGWTMDKHDEIAAHEMGHMMGNFDEYAGGATYAGRTETGSLMSDLTVAGMRDYFWGAEWFAEQEQGVALSTVAAIVGDALGNTLGGGAAMDPIYGLGGADHLNGYAANDLLMGGRGEDTLYGGAGADRLYGGANNDTFVFRSAHIGGDAIFDFAIGDHIDLTRMDANTSRADDQAFRFLGNFLTNPVFTPGLYGHMGYNTSTDTLFLETNGDGVADYSLRVEGISGLRAADFYL